MTAAVSVSNRSGECIAARLNLRLLGGFRLEYEGVDIAIAAHGQRLLAFLGVRGRTSRYLVAGTLWADATEERAKGSLRSTVWRLRRTQLPLVVSHGDTLELAPEVHVDVGDFSAVASRVLSPAAANVDDWAAVSAADELLPGWYDDWALFDRERLRQSHLHALEALARHFATRRLFAPALEAALQAVRIEPLRESAHRAVVAVHLAENNVVEAVRHFQEFRALLSRELGIEPSPEFSAILAGCAAAHPLRAAVPSGPAQRTSAL